MKLLYRFCLLIAIILSHIMCALVAYNYCNMEWEIKVGGTSVPVEMAYLYAIPFVIGIVLCLIGAFYFKKNHVNIIIRRYKCETKINQNVQKKTNLKTSLNNLEKIE